MKETLTKLQKPYLLYFLKLICPLAMLLVYLIVTNGITFTSLISYVVFYMLIYVIGTNIFFHRYWSHKHFSTNPLLVKIFTVAGLFSLVGGPLFYVLVHRQHHIHSDDKLDPHSPHNGRFHAFIGWIFKAHTLTIPIKLVKDLLVEKNRWLLHIDVYKIYIVYTGVICVYLLGTNIFIGLLLAMFTAFFIELYINAFLHDPVIKTSKNSNKVMCWITFGGMEHKLHHDGSTKTNAGDPAYPLINLLSKFS